MICKHCGTKVQDDARFCPVCGVKLDAQYTAAGTGRQGNYQSDQYNSYQYTGDAQNSFLNSLFHPEEQWDQDMYEEAYHFMGENQAFYGRKFQKMQAVRGTTDWNWCSFLFGGLWAFYRKMYLVGLIVLAASSILACIPVIGWVLSVGLSVCFGIWGNYLYMKHVQDSVCKYTRFSDTEKNLCYHSKGGVSVGAVFGAIGINILLSSIPAILINTIFAPFYLW